MNFQKIAYELRDAVAIIRLNEPERRNALSPQMAGELLTALKRAEVEARAILLTGDSKAFSSGANLAEGNFDLADPQRDVGLRLDDLYNPIVMQMRNSPRPIVTALGGPAVGVACGIALAGDLIIAAKNGCFIFAFSKIGLGPDGGSSYQLTRAVGRPRAMEIMMLGERVTAEQALAWGLINRVLPDEGFDEEVFNFTRNLAHGPSSLGNIKRVVWDSLDASIETVLTMERMHQRDNSRSDDFLEGVTAFREKRSPVFKGR